MQAGEPTTCASRILEGFVSPFDATVVGAAARRRRGDRRPHEPRRVRDGLVDRELRYGPTRNPWDLARTPGGSSGGSAAAVAAGIVPLALGSDTGGSIRQPAALCGVVGLKPTYGRVSRYGLVAFASSLDQIGPFARTAADCALLLEAIAGHDPRDSTSLPEPAPRLVGRARAATSRASRSACRASTSRREGVDARRARARARGGGGARARGREGARGLAAAHAHAIATYYLIATAEASSNLARYDGVRYGHRAAGAASSSPSCTGARAPRASAPR